MQARREGGTVDGDNLFIRISCEVYRWHLLDETMMPEFQTRLWFCYLLELKRQVRLGSRGKNGAGGNWVHILSCRIITRWEGAMLFRGN